MAAPPCKNVAFPFDSNDLIKTINPPFDREGSGFLGHTRDFLGRFLALKSEDGPKKSKQKCRCIRDGHRVIEDKVQMFSALYGTRLLWENLSCSNHWSLICSTLIIGTSKPVPCELLTWWLFSDSSILGDEIGETCSAKILILVMKVFVWFGDYEAYRKRL